MYTGSILNDEQRLALEAGLRDELEKAFLSGQRKYEIDLSFYARMFHIGCKYDIPLLRAKATASFIQDADKDVFFYRDLLRAVHIAFITGSDTESQMRECTFETLLKTISALSEYAWLPKEIEKIPGLAMKLITAMAKKM